MKITIDEPVKAKFPELRIFLIVIQNEAVVHGINNIVYDETSLTDLEFKDYQLFRKKVSGNTLLAVERLLERGENNLPKPDPKTTAVIHASYVTRLPITIFCNDSFSTIVIRFSKPGDVLKLDELDEEIEPGLLVADTEQGILGVLGTKSSTLGRLTDASKSVVILGFGCSVKTNKKSMKLVNQVTDHLLLYRDPIKQPL